MICVLQFDAASVGLFYPFQWARHMTAFPAATA
ncbi:MAG: hypothetical protein QOG42_146 [Solirubrobacteraceae bacterium]|nr:hypothetical protein [Solirubrobacteraceae bacterium]